MAFCIDALALMRCYSIGISPIINFPRGVFWIFSSFYLGELEMSNDIELYIILKLRISFFRIYSY